MTGLFGTGLVPGGEKVMKRTALLLAILAAFSITSVSQVCASPVIGEKAVTVSGWLSYYFASFMRAHRQVSVYEVREIDGNGNDVILRGDADDYANGKDDKVIHPDGPGFEEPNAGLGLPGGLMTGPGEVKIKY
jgi:hypothetical protein